MFGNFQFGQGQFGQSSGVESSPDANVTIDSLEAVAEIGAFSVSTSGGAGKPQWVPLIPLDWPVRKQPKEIVRQDVSVSVEAFGVVALVEPVLVRCDSSVFIQSFETLALAGRAMVFADARAWSGTIEAEADFGRVTVRAIRNPTDAELAMILLNV
jgi:hypothetical protein